MLISYRFLSCSTECSSQITPCCAVLRIFLGRESRRGLHRAVRTRFFQPFHVRTLHTGINHYTTMGYAKTALLFAIPYWVSWVLSELNAFWYLTFKKPIHISSVVTTGLFLAWPPRYRPLGDSTSCDFCLLKPGQQEFTFWFWLKTLSHLRRKAKFSPRSAITHQNQISALYWKFSILLSNSRHLQKAPQHQEQLFVEIYSTNWHYLITSRYFGGLDITRTMF